MKKKAKKVGTERLILINGVFSTTKSAISYSERTTLEIWKKHPIINYPKR